MAQTNGSGWYVAVRPRRRIFRGEKWGFEIVRDGNYETLAVSEGYVAQADAEYGAHLIADPAGAEVRVTSA